MAFDNPSNHTRVEKIKELIALIEKSARSNRAEPAEIAAMLAPACAAIRPHCLTCDETPSALMIDVTRIQDAEPQFQDAHNLQAMGLKPHPWHTVREMAQNAPLPDLILAMAVFINRLDDANLRDVA